MHSLRVRSSSRSLPLWIVALGTLAGVALVLAGDLNPPAGPVAPTFKTLSEIEPRIGMSLATTPGDFNSVLRISQPGSYYLMGAVTGVAGKHGIKIESDNVTLDLNGFTLSGVASTGDGIHITPTRRNITIKNGTVRGFASSGIFAKHVNGGTVRDVIVQGNMSDGFWVGSEMLLHNVKVISNANQGFVIDQRNQVMFESCLSVDNDAGFQGSSSQGISFKDCSARENREHGFFVGSECRFVNCHALGNDFSGFDASLRARFESCVAQFNSRHGFATSEGARLISCTADNNGQDGMNLGNRSYVERSVGLQNALSGILVGVGSTVIDCIGTLNTATGIAVGDGSTVERCNVSDNNGTGIFATDACTIRACSTFSNAFDGIRVNAACLVIDNNLQGDGVAPGPQGGIRIEAGAGNRVEGNNITGCDNSIFTATAAAQGNFFARNTSRTPASGHYVFVAGNSYGPVVVVTGVGNFAATPNSTHPMANFTY